MSEEEPRRNYSSLQHAASLGKQDDTSEFDTSWLNVVDTLIENYMGTDYKGRTHTVDLPGSGGQLLKLPKTAKTITSVTELDGQGLVPAAQYRLGPRGRILTRTAVSLFGSTPFAPYTTWQRYLVYQVELKTPNLDELPTDWEFCATAMLNHILQFSFKYRDFGIALSHSGAGQAGKVATSDSESFPASLEEDLKKKMQRLLRRPIV